MLLPKQTKIVCVRCKKTINGARTVIHEQWHCGDCTYILENPGAVVTPAPRATATKQEETLFPLPAPERRIG